MAGWAGPAFQRQRRRRRRRRTATGAQRDLPIGHDQESRLLRASGYGCGDREARAGHFPARSGHPRLGKRVAGMHADGHHIERAQQWGRNYGAGRMQRQLAVGRLRGRLRGGGENSPLSLESVTYCHLSIIDSSISSIPKHPD